VFAKCLLSCLISSLGNPGILADVARISSTTSGYAVSIPISGQPEADPPNPNPLAGRCITSFSASRSDDKNPQLTNEELKNMVTSLMAKGGITVDREQCSAEKPPVSSVMMMLEVKSVQKKDDIGYSIALHCIETLSRQNPPHAERLTLIHVSIWKSEELVIAAKSESGRAFEQSVESVVSSFCEAYKKANP